MMEEEIEIDISDAEALLKKAKLALDMEEARRAKNLSKKARRTAEDRVLLFENAVNSIEIATKTIARAKRARIDVSEARALLEQAKSALKGGEYEDAIRLAEASIGATFVKPKVGKEITAKTVIAKRGGKILYKIQLKNNVGEALEKIRVLPDLSNTPFMANPQEQIIDIPPYKEVTLMFELVPTDYDAYATVEDVVIGRDTSVFTVLGLKDGKSFYRVKVRNETDRVLENVRIEPFVPEGFSAVPRDAIVTIPPNASKTVEFAYKKGKTRRHEEKECPYCHGTFIMETGAEVVICPWCNSEVVLKKGKTLKRKKEIKKKGRAKKGARKEISAKTCPVCEGYGNVMVKDERGTFVEEICPRCDGAGKI